MWYSLCIGNDMSLDDTSLYTESSFPYFNFQAVKHLWVTSNSESVLLSAVLCE